MDGELFFLVTEGRLEEMRRVLTSDIRRYSVSLYHRSKPSHIAENEMNAKHSTHTVATNTDGSHLIFSASSLSVSARNDDATPATWTQNPDAQRAVPLARDSASYSRQATSIIKEVA